MLLIELVSATKLTGLDVMDQFSKCSRIDCLAMFILAALVNLLSFFLSLHRSAKLYPASTYDCNWSITAMRETNMPPL